MVFYEGPEAVLYIRDPELIKQITMRDFDHFMDLGFQSLKVRDMEVNDMGLVNATGDQWRKLKGAISPAFSLKNLKNGTKLINSVNPNVI